MSYMSNFIGTCVVAVLMQEDAMNSARNVKSFKRSWKGWKVRMKYIRTKDGIYKVRKPFAEETLWEDSTYVFKHEHIKNNDIVKQADTIEELCDGLVLFYDSEETKPDLIYRGGFNDLYFQNELKHSAKCYGAIWTSKGLIYVAKMNHKGELELI